MHQEHSLRRFRSITISQKQLQHVCCAKILLDWQTRLWSKILSLFKCSFKHHQKCKIGVWYRSFLHHEELPFDFGHSNNPLGSSPPISDYKQHWHPEWILKRFNCLLALITRSRSTPMVFHLMSSSLNLLPLSLVATSSSKWFTVSKLRLHLR